MDRTGFGAGQFPDHSKLWRDPVKSDHASRAFARDMNFRTVLALAVTMARCAARIQG